MIIIIISLFLIFLLVLQYTFFEKSKKLKVNDSDLLKALSLEYFTNFYFSDSLTINKLGIDSVINKMWTDNKITVKQYETLNEIVYQSMPSDNLMKKYPINDDCIGLERYHESFWSYNENGFFVRYYYLCELSNNVLI